MLAVTLVYSIPVINKELMNSSTSCNIALATKISRVYARSEENGSSAKSVEAFLVVR